MKTNQSAFIRDLVIEESFIECNANIIPIKADFTINIAKSKNYEELDLQGY